jgi:hypothetical protein
MTDEMHFKPSSLNRNRLNADANKLNRKHTAMTDDEALSPVPHSRNSGRPGVLRGFLQAFVGQKPRCHFGELSVIDHVDMGVAYISNFRSSG